MSSPMQDSRVDEQVILKLPTVIIKYLVLNSARGAVRVT